jgi:copper chaperone CopZ
MAQVAEEAIQVPGIHCAGCAKRIKGALEHVAGVAAVRVSVRKRAVTLRYDPEQVGLCQLAEWLGVIGYPNARAQRGKRLPMHALAVRAPRSTQVTNVSLVSRAEYARIAALSARGGA